MARNIFLVGLRGSGKSTVGRELAEALSCGFVDLDHYLKAREGKSVAEIVEAGGWEAFRKLEKDCLREACALSPERRVFATGGGLALDAENRAFMRANGLVIWLEARPEALARRLEASPEPGQRPAFSAKPLLEEMRDLAWERWPRYQAAAHCIVDGERASSEICELLRAIVASEG